jgi:sulfite reductase alpha subunit-like flavoprotein
MFSLSMISLKPRAGEPPDNAGHFIEWLSGLSGNALGGVKYSVFGCGHHDWVQTYQRIPKLCDEIIAARGGKRLLERGEADAASASFFESFETYETKLWSILEQVRPVYDIVTVRSFLSDTIGIPNVAYQCHSVTSSPPHRRGRHDTSCSSAAELLHGPGDTEQVAYTYWCASREAAHRYAKTISPFS